MHKRNALRERIQHGRDTKNRQSFDQVEALCIHNAELSLPPPIDSFIEELVLVTLDLLSGEDLPGRPIKETGGPMLAWAKTKWLEC